MTFSDCIAHSNQSFNQSINQIYFSIISNYVHIPTNLQNNYNMQTTNKLQQKTKKQQKQKEKGIVIIFHIE